jgi:mannose-6-phosphate isomerase-like protein (cupin superfamily)
MATPWACDAPGRWVRLTPGPRQPNWLHSTADIGSSPDRHLCVWRLALAANTPGTVHTLDREEIFVVLAGRAIATIDDVSCQLAPGDALIVPAQHPFSLANPHDEVFEAIAVLPVGGLAAMPSGAPFAPPWTA